MKKILSIITVLLIVTLLLGCLDAPSVPGFDYPDVIVYHPEDSEDETIINLRAMELVMFENVVIYINSTENDETRRVERNDTFGPEVSTTHSHFELDIFVRQEEERYNFNATFELYPEENVPEEYQDEELVYRITFYDGEEDYITRDDLPFTETLNRIEEDDN